jgi:hypothetical protein
MVLGRAGVISSYRHGRRGVRASISKSFLVLFKKEHLPFA